MRQTQLNHFLCIVLVTLPTVLLAQDSAAPSGKRVGILLDSTKARVRDLLARTARTTKEDRNR